MIERANLDSAADLIEDHNRDHQEVQTYGLITSLVSRLWTIIAPERTPSGKEPEGG